jgi:hypothetical protein
MRGTLSSARLRRRLFWGGLFILVAGGVAGLVLAFPSPSPEKGAKMTTIEGDVVQQPKGHSFAPRRGEVLAVARRFLLTAVTRKHTAASWDLVTPSLKSGYTRKTWAKGDIPVVPFLGPIGVASIKVDLSYSREALLEVFVLPKAGYDAKGQIFFMNLKKIGTGRKAHWVVDSWSPRSNIAVPDSLSR